MPQNTFDGKSNLVQVMAWCNQAPSHYLSQFWPKFLSLYDVTKPQWAQTDVSFCKICVIIVSLPMSLEGDIGIALSICLGIRSLVYLSHFWNFFTCPTKPIIWLVSTKWRPFRSGLDVIKIDIQAKPAFADMKDLSPPNVNLKKLYESETKPSEPILIIISPGADPSQDLEDLAKGTIGSDKYHQVSYFCGWICRNQNTFLSIAMIFGVWERKPVTLCNQNCACWWPSADRY